MTDLKELLTLYPYKTELHTHTWPVSACGHISPETLVARYAALGCHTLTLTNHLNPLWMEGDPKERAKEYLADYHAAIRAAKGTGMTVALGVEIRFPENNNDYLIYGVCPEDVEHFIRLIPYGIRNFYKEAKTDRNVILQAHPFRKGMELAPTDSIDGIETMNMHPDHNSKVARATDYARKHGFLVSGGSDCHEEQAVASCLTRTKTPLADSYDIARTIQEKSMIFDLSGHIVIPHLYE